MGTPHVLVLDEGTTSTKAALFDDRSRVVASSALPLTITTHPDGRVEQDATELWEASRSVIGDVVAAAEEGGLEIAALAIAVQRTTTVLWDAETGRPVAPVVNWQDTRAAARVTELSAEWAAPAKTATGLVLGPAHVGLHLDALLAGDTALRELADQGRLRAGTPETWIIWNLTGGTDGGVYATSTSCAGSTGLLDIRTDTWWPELLDELGVPGTALPQVLPEDADYGTTREALVGAGIPITGVLGDQQAALYGHGAFEAGAVKCTHGTGSFINFHVGPDAVDAGDGLDCRVAWTTAGSRAYMLEGGSFVTGSGVDWMVEQLGVLPTADRIDAVYAEGRADSGLISVPALAGFAAPYWDSTARGMMIGFNRGTTAADVVRATVDGTAHTVVDIIETMARNAGTTPTVVLVDGGLSRSDALLQSQADLLQIPVVRAAHPEYITARGAAWCAGIARGVWADEAAATATRSEGREFTPRMSPEERTVRRRAWQDAVSRALGWQRAELPSIPAQGTRS
ncbi:FGGY family carbohydrate kinase [Streptomyces sp. NPDC058045]|uniref:FGGY family carbohydrate kinase n=1 Tax=Streptomyces sp. NPDC058045 TaxID=3346311 RepID=UPI0036E410B2